MGQPNSKSQKLAISKLNNSTGDETQNNNLILVRNRVQQHADNMNFLLNMADMPHVLTILIFEYVSFDAKNITRHGLIYISGKTGIITCPFVFFKINEDKIREFSDTEMQAMVLAENHILPAGPLNALKIEAEKNLNALLHPIRKNITLGGVDFTLEGSPLQLSIILLDQTLQISGDPTVPAIDQGQAEFLLGLIPPGRISEAKKQVCFAACFDPAVKHTKRLKVLNDALDQIQASNFDGAGQIIKDYIIRTKPDVIIDNQYFSNILQLLSDAFDLFITRANDLQGGWYGDQADQFCFKIIGMIEKVLPLKLRKILETGLYYSLYQGKNVDRTLNVSDAFYLRTGNGRMGIDRFFDDIAQRGGRELRGWRACASATVFKTFIRNYINAAELMQQSSMLLNPSKSIRGC